MKGEITMKIGKNVAILSLPSPIKGMPNINPVLTWDDKNLVLIDTGFPKQGKIIAKAIEAEGLSAEKLTHIIITHQDMDHIGSTLELQKKAPNVQIIAHKEEAPYLDGRKVPVKLASMLEKYNNLPLLHKFGCKRAQKMYRQMQVKFHKELQDKEVLPICGGIEVVHTPGHTPGHITLYLHESRIMVCGDGANITDGQLSGPNPTHTQDMELGMKSLEKIKGYPMVGAVTYHGGYLEI